MGGLIPFLAHHYPCPVLFLPSAQTGLSNHFKHQASGWNVPRLLFGFKQETCFQMVALGRKVSNFSVLCVFWKVAGVLGPQIFPGAP